MKTLRERKWLKGQKELFEVINHEDYNRLGLKNVSKIMKNSFAEGKIVSVKSQDTNDFLSGAGKTWLVFSETMRNHMK